MKMRTTKTPEVMRPEKKGKPLGALSTVCPVPVCLLSDKDAAKFLGISRSLLRTYSDKGKLKAVRLPHPSGVGYFNRTLFDVEDLRRFVLNAKGEKEESQQ